MPTKLSASPTPPSTRPLALEAARKSIVLLKNDGSLLPLDRTQLRTLAVIGPNAKGVHLGGYSRDPGRGVDVLSGITAAAGAGVRGRARGRRAHHGARRQLGLADAVVLGDPAHNRARIEEAVKVARAGRRHRHS